MTTATSDGRIGFAVHNGVATVELVRPDKRNAVTAAMWQEMTAHLTGPELERAHVVIVRGAGGAFSAGADLNAVKDADGSTSASYRAIVVAALDALRAVPVPTVARVDGVCVGGGVSLALACDIRLAGPGARFWIPAVRHSIVYDEGSIARLVSLLGAGRASRFLYAATRVNGAQAERIGLVDEYDDDLDTAQKRLVDAILAADRTTLTATTEILRGFAGTLPR